MDGIAAVEARLAEICQRFAPPPPAAPAAPAGANFAAHAQTGHADILDPVDNLSAAIDYIKDRYGDPSNTPGLRALARGDHYVGY